MSLFLAIFSVYCSLTPLLSFQCIFRVNERSNEENDQRTLCNFIFFISSCVKLFSFVPSIVFLNMNHIWYTCLVFFYKKNVDTNKSSGTLFSCHGEAGFAQNGKRHSHKDALKHTFPLKNMPRVISAKKHTHTPDAKPKRPGQENARRSVLFQN